MLALGAKSWMVAHLGHKTQYKPQQPARFFSSANFILPWLSGLAGGLQFPARLARIQITGPVTVSIRLVSPAGRSYPDLFRAP